MLARGRRRCAAQAAIDKKGLGPVPWICGNRRATPTICWSFPDPVARDKGGGRVCRRRWRSIGYRAIGVEGVREGRWALLDYGDLVVHVFDHPLREFYDLEGMWFDAPKLELQVPPEQRIVPGALSYADEAGRRIRAVRVSGEVRRRGWPPGIEAGDRLLGLVLGDVVDGIADGLDLLSVLVGDLHIEFFF